MNRRPSRSALAGAALVLVMTACSAGSDATGPSDSELTEAEVSDVIVAVFESVNEAYSSVYGVPAAAAPAQPASQQFNTTVPCDAGGSADVSVVISDNIDFSGNGTFTVNETSTWSGCGVITSGRTLTLSGSLQANGQWSYANYTPSGNFTWHMGGTVNWVAGTAGAGSCPISIDVTVDPDTYASTWSGSACGRPYSQST